MSMSPDSFMCLSEDSTYTAGSARYSEFAAKRLELGLSVECLVSFDHGTSIANHRVVLRLCIAQKRSGALYPHDRYTFGPPSVLNWTNQVVASPTQSCRQTIQYLCKVARHRASGSPTQAPLDHGSPLQYVSPLNGRTQTRAEPLSRVEAIVLFPHRPGGHHMHRLNWTSARVLPEPEYVP